MLFNDIFIIELIILFLIFFYIITIYLLTLLYIGGLYLVFLGFLGFLNDSDIYIGFLWVIDLGVGLIFFIFILHFTSFLFQKSQLNISFRYFIFSLSIILFFIIFYYYYAFYNDTSFYNNLLKTWSFNLTYLDYYTVFFTNEVTDLNTLKDSYFLFNSFEFFLINFSLFFGLITSIIMCFLIQRVFNFLNLTQILNSKLLDSIDSGFFIRNQNFITQQNKSAVVRIWLKSNK